MNNNTENRLNISFIRWNDCHFGHRPSLTRPFHHDRGRFVIAVSPRRGEQGALGRRLRRGQQFYSDVINALRARTKILYHVKYEFEHNSTIQN
jgi:hypothetical protein